MRTLFTGHTPKRTKRSFTLLELVVALVILIILSALAIPTFQTVITNSKTATTEASVKAVYDDAAALCVNQPLSSMGGCLATAASETTAAAGLAPGQLDAAAAWTVAAENTPVTTPGVIGWSVVGTNLGLAALTADGTTAVYIDAPNTTTWSCANTTGDPAVAIAGVNSCTSTPDTTTTTVADTTTTTVPDTTTTTTGPPVGIISTLVASPAVATPTGSTLSPDGNTLYVADAGDGEVLAIDLTNPSHTTTVVAGDGIEGVSGDGGPATAAQLNQPLGVAVSPDGTTLYIVDSGARQIRAVNLSGSLLYNVAGSGTDVGPGDITTVAGDEGDAVAGDGGEATLASFETPTSIAVTSTTLYVGDGNATDIRAIDLSSGIITTLIGSAGPGYSGDGGPVADAQIGNGISSLAASPDGNTLFIADTGNLVVRAVDLTTNTISTVAGDQSLGYGNAGDGGPATSAQLYFPSGVSVSPDGTTLAIATGAYYQVRSVNLTTHVITTVAGVGVTGEGYTGDGGPATTAELNYPTYATVSNTDYYITDSDNMVIRQVTRP